MDRAEQSHDGESGNFRSGYVAIAGFPNAGKSTLLNTVLHQKLGIVTPKPQTTRRRTLGVRTTESSQMIFVDTPGILEPRYDLQKAMMQQVEESVTDADVILYLVDLSNPRMAPSIVALSGQKPVIIILNKADLLPRREEALPIIADLQSQGNWTDFFTISALKGKGIEPLLARIEGLLPRGPHFFPPDQVTEHTERFFVTELIREAIFELFRDEVPYGTEAEITTFKEHHGEKDLIEATVFVETESQKGIVIGKGGQAIKRLGQRARRSIEAFLDRPVFLALQVKVMPNWRKDKRALKRFGYGLPRSKREDA